MDQSPNASESTPHWTTLLARIIDDASRIFRAQGALLEITLRETIEEQTTRLLAGLVVGAASMCSLLCMLIATVLLIHKWLEWWSAFGVTGAAGLLIAILAYYLRLRRARSQTGSSLDRPGMAPARATETTSE